MKTKKLSLKIIFQPKLCFNDISRDSSVCICSYHSRNRYTKPPIMQPNDPTWTATAAMLHRVLIIISLPKNLIEMKNPKHFPLKWVFNEPFLVENQGFFMIQSKQKPIKPNMKGFQTLYEEKLLQNWSKSFSVFNENILGSGKRKSQSNENNLMEKATNVRWSGSFASLKLNLFSSCETTSLFRFKNVLELLKEFSFDFYQGNFTELVAANFFSDKIEFYFHRLLINCWVKNLTLFALKS